MSGPRNEGYATSPQGGFGHPRPDRAGADDGAMGKAAMRSDWQSKLETAIWSDRPLGEMVDLLRQFKDLGIARAEVYAFLEALREKPRPEAVDDRILEVADFVAGFCSPHMKVWGEGDAS